MKSESAVRITITVFILILLTVVAMGWNWTQGHQPPALRTASHIVLAIAGGSGIFAVVKIWSARPR